MPFAAFFSNNPIVAWGIVLLTAFGLYKGKEQADRMIGARKQQRKMEAKARRVQIKLQEENNEKSTQVERARASAPRGVNAADSVPDDISSIIFGDN